MAGSKFFGEPKFGEGPGGVSGSSSSRRRGISPSEFLRRLHSQLAAIPPNASHSDMVHRVVTNNPPYPVTCPNNLKVQSPYYPLLMHSSIPSSFLCATTVTPWIGGQGGMEGMRMDGPYYVLWPLSVPPLTASHEFHRPQGIRLEDLNLQLMPGSSSSSSTPGIYFPRTTEMTVGSEDENGCDLELRLGTRWNHGKSVSNPQQNRKMHLVTELRRGQEAEEETGHKNKKARTDSFGAGSESSGSNSGQDIDLELRLSL